MSSSIAKVSIARRKFLDKDAALSNYFRSNIKHEDTKKKYDRFEQKQYKRQQELDKCNKRYENAQDAVNTLKKRKREMDNIKKEVESMEDAKEDVIILMKIMIN